MEDEPLTYRWVPETTYYAPGVSVENYTVYAPDKMMDGFTRITRLSAIETADAYAQLRQVVMRAIVDHDDRRG